MLWYSTTATLDAKPYVNTMRIISLGDEKMADKNPDRRSFFSKIAKLGVAGGIGALLLGRLGLPKASASPAYVELGVSNDAGSGSTGIDSTSNYATAYIRNFNSTAGDAIFAWSKSGTGVLGSCAATSGENKGVYGESISPSGVGVYGKNNTNGIFPLPTPKGVWGEATGDFGIGVCGKGKYAGVQGTGPRGVEGSAETPSSIAITAWGATGQTADLQWWGIPGTVLSVVNKDGWMGIGTPSPARQLHIQWNQAVSRMDRDVDSSAFIFVRPAPGNFGTVWKSFMFGADASGVNNGRFVIGDLGTAVGGISNKRLVIDNSGRVGIGTETPTELLHVAGNVKATGFITGDMKFANNYTVTEDEKEGLAFKNDAGEKIAVLDREGNFHIKGDLIKDL